MNPDYSIPTSAPRDVTSVTPSPRHAVTLWFVIGALLLTWNGTLGTLASPFVLLHRYDGVQYQLLARNRLQGHYEVADEAHSVHLEGRHPMWRPGLVWIEEGLARGLGSVRRGAAAASALGTTLLELALLCLAWRLFDRSTFLSVLIVLAVPALSFPFMILAVGQGPEVWAATAIVAGLILLVEALRRRSARWALAAGTVAGLSEWFRTGNLLLFAVPCAVYSLSALRMQTRRQGDTETRRRVSWSPCLRVSVSPCLIPALALLAWVAVAAAADLAVPSPVNKTVANLWDCRTDMGGPSVVEERPDGTHLVISMLGYSLVPVQGTHLQTGPVKSATYFDYAVRSSRGRSTLDFLRGHAGLMARAYIQHLQQVLTSGLRGLRQAIGNLIVLLFGVQLLCSVGNRVKPSDPFSENAASHTFAVAGAALGHYFGPVVLIAGDAPTQYILMALPLFVLVAARGAVRLVVAGCNHFGLLRTVRFSAADVDRAPWLLTAWTAAVLIGAGVLSYAWAQQRLYELQRLALEEQAAVDALCLEGKKVACRNMCWFVDRQVQTILLPYATVPELEVYVRDHNVDGILVWEKEPTPFFNATPYDSPAAFGRALQESPLFGPPRNSGTWRWYPVLATATAKEQP